MKKKLLVPLIAAIIGGAFTQGVQLSANLWMKTKAKAVLVKEVVNWNPSTVPQAVQNQIKYVPVTYTLRHNSGGAADHISVFVQSDAPLDPNGFVFTPDSEVHQIGLSDARTLRIDVPEIRPSGVLSFQFVTTNSTHIQFSERAADADFVETKDLANQNQKSAWKETGIIAAISLVWIAGVAAAIFVCLKIGKYWKESEELSANPKIKLLIAFIIGVLLYNTVLSSLSLVGGFLPLPRIGFDELTGAFIFYLVVTRYKLVEEWIKSHTKKEATAAPAPDAPTAGASAPTKTARTAGPTVSIKANGDSPKPAETLVEV